jgi:predicted RNA binding protein YcfA (HicA-like mRNA interferase family)
MASEVRFAEVRRVLEHHGWTLERISGSHFIFRKEGEARHISIPVHGGRVAPGYLKRLARDHGVRF